MAETSSSQEERGVWAKLWWIVVSGILLAMLDAAVVFWAASIVQPYANYLDLSLRMDLSFLGNETLAMLYLQYLMLLGLIMVLVGLMRGWVTGKADSSLLLSLEASLFGGVLGFGILPLVLSQVVNGELARTLLVALAMSPIVIGFQGILSAAVGGAGGLVGSRFLPRQGRIQEAASQQGERSGVGFWWLIIPGLLLVALHTILVLVEVVRLNPLYFSLVLHLDLGMLEREDQTDLYLQHLFSCLFIFLLIGITQGYVSQRARSASFGSMLVCVCAGFLGFIALPLVLGAAIGGEIGLSFLMVIARSPLWMGLQLVLAAVGGWGGGLIGCHFLHKRPGRD